eukprot:Colp12_sorted_trinity150504_noHs@27973
MAFRSRTNLFRQLRESSHRRKGSSQQLDRWATYDDDNSRDPEALALLQGGNAGSSLPPQWVDIVEEIQTEIERLKTRMRELSVLHDKHVNRPAFDSYMEEEHTIEIMTEQITENFSTLKAAVQRLSGSKNATEQRMLKNVRSALALDLQNLSGQFRRSQTMYLQRLRSREQGRARFEDTNAVGDFDEEYVEELAEKGFSARQIAVMEGAERTVMEREKEITEIAKSITKLADLFRELNTMVIDQGTVLDRIDYNVEQTYENVGHGVEELKKGETYQRKSTKKYLIILLILFVVFMLFMVIFVKKHTW